MIDLFWLNVWINCRCFGKLFWKGGGIQLLWDPKLIICRTEEPKLVIHRCCGCCLLFQRLSDQLAAFPFGLFFVFNTKGILLNVALKNHQNERLHLKFLYASWVAKMKPITRFSFQSNLNSLAASVSLSLITFSYILRSLPSKFLCGQNPSHARHKASPSIEEKRSVRFRQHSWWVCVACS